MIPKERIQSIKPEDWPIFVTNTPVVESASLFLHDTYRAAKVLGLEVPWKGESGLLPEHSTLPYTWGSYDGRSTDWLLLEARADQWPEFCKVLLLLHTAKAYNIGTNQTTDSLTIVRPEL